MTDPTKSPTSADLIEQVRTKLESEIQELIDYQAKRKEKFDEDTALNKQAIRDLRAQLKKLKE